MEEELPAAHQEPVQAAAEDPAQPSEPAEPLPAEVEELRADETTIEVV